jgi:hypothetical protein
LRLGFYLSQFIGRCVLTMFFIFVITPLGVSVDGQRSIAAKTSGPRGHLLASGQR